MSKRKSRLLGIGFAALLIAVWMGIAVSVGRPYLLPSPVDVAVKLWEDRAVLFTEHLPATMKVVFLGGGLSILVGAVFAVLMDLFPVCEKALYPILTLSQAIPVICLSPIFVLWFGYTVKMRVIVVILVNFFPVTVNLFDGLRATKDDRMELMRSFGASRMQSFLFLRFPTSLPYLFTALRIAVPWAVIAAAVSEWLGAPKGLGTFSRYYMMNLDAAGLLAPLVLLAAAALLLNGILKWIEDRIVFWRGES
ncbi:MAG: ABC transporter permease [Eubacteriales bacterium]|nr:ABC transporter permease [Eubacteriales bacterium]